MFSTAPPGYPKTTSTPRSSSDLTKISAPVIFTASSLRLLRRPGARAPRRAAPPRGGPGAPVPAPHEGDPPPLQRLGRDMPDAGSVGPSGKPPVGDQRHLRPQPHPHDRGGGGAHLAHPRAALRAFVPGDHPP